MGVKGGVSKSGPLMTFAWSTTFKVNKYYKVCHKISKKALNDPQTKNYPTRADLISRKIYVYRGDEDKKSRIIVQN